MNVFPESLLRHCCHYRDSASSGTNEYIFHCHILGLLRNHCGSKC
ncbi:hypothetical protein CsSME_00043105 [Camellia sinensis var. sinensis]